MRIGVIGADPQRHYRWDDLDRFTERAANTGSLGVFETKYLIRYMQANAKRLDKFGV